MPSGSLADGGGGARFKGADGLARYDQIMGPKRASSSAYTVNQNARYSKVPISIWNKLNFIWQISTFDLLEICSMNTEELFFFVL